jgi:glycerol kinase
MLEALRARGSRRATSPRSASPTSARPRALGPRHRRARGARHRLAGPAHRRRLRQLRARGLEPEIAPAPACCSIRISRRPSSPGCSTSPGRTARARARRTGFGTIDSWLISSSPGIAARHRRHQRQPHAALQPARRRLDDRLLELLRVPRACLPEIVDSCLRARTRIEIELDGAQLPLTGIAGDQQAALFGQACFAPGMAKNTYGTGCFALHEHRRRSARRAPAAVTVALAPRRRQFALEGGVFMGGATVQWLRDGLGMIERSADVEALAASCLTPAMCTWCRRSRDWGAAMGCGARGTIIGSDRGRPARTWRVAALESIAFQTADLIDAMQRTVVTRSRNCVSTVAPRVMTC